MPAPNHKAPLPVQAPVAPARDAEAAFEAALAARRQGDWQGSLDHLQSAISLAPRNARYHAEAGAALFMLDRHAEAAGAYERALAIDPNHLPSLNNLGVILSLAGKFKDAEALLQQSASLNPSQLDVWLNLCSAVEGQDYREEDQVAFARKAVSLAPRNPSPYRFLGKALLRIGDTKAALDTFAIARSLAPSDADIAYSIAICHVELDDVPMAVWFFQEALAIDPGHGRTYYALAEFLYRLEEYSAAEEAARHAADLLDDKIATGMLLARILFASGKHSEGQDSYVQARSRQDALIHARTGKPASQSKFVLSPVSGIRDWCVSQGLPYRVVLPESQWHACKPVIFAERPFTLPLAAAPIPEAYVAEIREATVLPGHEVILVDQESQIIYDRLIRMGDWYSLREDSATPLIDNTHVLVESGEPARKSLKSGISLFSDGWYNYAHWLVEQLPRIFSVEQFPEYLGMPLLVNEGLYPQQMESLRLASKGQFPITVLSSSNRHRIERLVVPSNLTQFIKRRYRSGEKPCTADGPFHPEAINFLRTRLLPVCADDNRPRRRLWLSRKAQIKTGQRRLLNEPEIEKMLLQHGFEILHPETMSFREQVAAFAAAEMIAGPAGAAMINIAFAPPGARVLIFTKDHPEVNFHYFTNIGQIAGFEVAHVCGRTVGNFGVQGFESDFTVDLELARRAVREFFAI